jgi:nitrogen fixation protein FixH
MTNLAQSQPKPLTGRKVLLIAVSAFGVIFGANMALVYAAIGSFPGLEVKNTYVASQVFDIERQAQIKLGWRVTPTYDGTNLVLAINGEDGQPAKVGALDVTIGRATTDVADITLDLAQGPDGQYHTALPLAPGKWEIRLKAKSAGGVAFHQRLPIFVKN